MRRVALIVALACSFNLPAWGDATVLAELPANPPLARYDGGEGLASIGWFFTSDAPLKERRVAQTVQVSKDGTAQGIAFKLTGNGTQSLGGDPAYQLVVYESETPPQGKIGSQSIYKREGVLRRAEGGDWLAFTLDEALALHAGRYYTFVFHFIDPSPENRVILEQSAGQDGVAWRWHQDQRGSWSASKNSLHFVLY